ncbi:MAG: FecR family protein [Magnetospirillum sp. WYHS-4]
MALGLGRWELTDDEPAPQALAIDPSGRVRLPADRPPALAAYSREEGNLVLTWRDGSALSVAGFFMAAEPPDLQGDDGCRVPGSLARHLGDPQPTAGESVAKVALTGGETFIHRAGKSEAAGPGSVLMAGDILDTGEAAVLALLLRKGGVVVLGEASRLALYVVDGSTLSMLKGNMVFQTTADPGLSVDTPVATLRLQGLRCGLDLPDGRNLTAVHMGGKGEASIVNGRGTRALKAPGTFTTVTSFGLEASSVGVMEKDDANHLFEAPLGAMGMLEGAAKSAPQGPAGEAKEPLRQALGTVAEAVKGNVAPKSGPEVEPAKPEHSAVESPKAVIKAAISAKPAPQPAPKPAPQPAPKPAPPPVQGPVPVAGSLGPAPRREIRYFLAPDMETARRGGIGIDFLYGGAPDERLGSGLPDGTVVRGRSRREGDG